MEDKYLEKLVEVYRSIHLSDDLIISLIQKKEDSIPNK